jgi:hypothetical protein
MTANDKYGAEQGAPEGTTHMSQTLTISDELLARLQTAARRRGLDSVEQLLETWQASEEELARFYTLAEQWKKDTAHQSNIAKRALHPGYQEIIGMGERVIPLLLAELRREPDDWFWALHAITGANPVPEASRGNLRAMAEAWCQWGLGKG